MQSKTIKRYIIGDMEVVYCISGEGRVSFSIVPAVLCSASASNPVASGNTPADRRKEHFEKGNIDAMVQISCLGDSSSPGFAAGETRHNSGLTLSMKYVSQTEQVDGNEVTIVTVLDNGKGIRAEHVVKGKSDSRSICVYVTVENRSSEEMIIEKIASFCLSGITPYSDDEGRDRLLLHRFRSRWSEEGRHEVRTAEELLLEPSWSNFGVRCEKYGAVGSMPVRGFFPFIGIEDREAGVIWGAVNACSGSWQIEVVRIDENMSVSGGLADFEYGHWRKKLKPGEHFTTPKSYLTVTTGTVSKLCDRLLDAQRECAVIPQKLPVLFNEYCTTWGEPSEEKISEILSVIKAEDFDYFIIDAGWYADSVKGWQDNMGDWRIAEDLFPNGLKTVVDKIKAAGMKAGIWFELEVVGKDADAVNDKAHLLTRDGKVIISGTRRFWDMRMDWVNDYLSARVIDFLNENGFEYIKIDYNDTIGIGCDGAESYGEGLRECMEATKHFFRKIREKVPHIAIEICSSGGHRLEHGFMELADYLSFSDAHEEKEIPVIAADLQNLILPSKSQIWAVLRKEDELKRIVYSLCAGMYGVLCISGDVFELSPKQWECAREGMCFYRKAAPIIAGGVTHRYGPFQKSNRALKDYQASVRYGEDGRALIIVHSFAHEGIQKIRIPLQGDYRIDRQYETGNHNIMITGSGLDIQFAESFDAVAVLIQPLCKE